MKMINKLWMLPLLLGALAGCAPERRISHAEKMEALGQMLGVSAEEAENQLNRNTARQRRQEQEAARQAAFARQQAEAQRQQQQIELQNRLNQAAAEQAKPVTSHETRQLVLPSPDTPPSTKPSSSCPNLKNIDRSRHGSAVCVE